MKSTFWIPPLALALTGCRTVISEQPFVALGQGTGLLEWSQLDRRPAQWTDLGNGVIEVAPGTGNLVTKAHFGDALIELDFMTPLIAEAAGQARGNSGVYVQGLYEVQVLDSYGMEPGLDTCGAIYNVSAASASVCLPPEVWQHYKIEFSAPRFDSRGDVTRAPRISVWQNGALIQEDVVLESPTGSASGKNPVEYGPLMLQDHGNKVRFRNIRITAH